MEYIKDKIDDIIPNETSKYIDATSDFLETNSAIAKAVFLLFIIFIFVFLFIVGSKIIMFFFQPSNSPVILDKMISSGESKTISQNLDNPKSIPIFRSIDQYNGLEFTYSLWVFVEQPPSNDKYAHIFNKGSDNGRDNGILSPNNSPGLYLYSGKYNNRDNTKYNTDSSINQLGMLVILNVFFDKIKTTKENSKNFPNEERVYIDGIPLKKWVNIIIRVNQQNIVDIYINGTLTKRHKLKYPVRQNYDSININRDNNYVGNLTSFKYYNYAIGTFEVDKIINDGPNLQTRRESNLAKSTGRYLANSWFYSGL